MFWKAEEASGRDGNKVAGKLPTVNGHVSESGVWLLTTQKSILERQGWWKGKFALFQRPATRVGAGADWSPPATPSITISVGRSL